MIFPSPSQALKRSLRSLAPAEMQSVSIESNKGAFARMRTSVQRGSTSSLLSGDRLSVAYGETHESFGDMLRREARKANAFYKEELHRLVNIWEVGGGDIISSIVFC